MAGVIGLALTAVLVACGAPATASPVPIPSASVPASHSAGPAATSPTPSSVTAATLGEILFCSKRDRTDGMDGIYVMHADGSDARVLSNTPGATDWMPTFSPDGTKIAFGSNRLGNRQAIYLMNPDGSGQTRITDNPFNSYRPSWSPDGKQIVFASADSGELFVINADGSAQMRLTAGQSGHPSWSPSGKLIAFSGQEPTDSVSEISVVNVDGSGRRQLTHDGQTNEKPSWSPDGTRIAFDSKRGGNFDIFVMNADGTGERRLTTEAAVDEWPAWSPDGRSIAFVHELPGGAAIDVIKADGSGQTTVTEGQDAGARPGTEAPTDVHGVWPRQHRGRRRPAQGASRCHDAPSNSRSADDRRTPSEGEIEDDDRIAVVEGRIRVLEVCGDMRSVR